MKYDYEQDLALSQECEQKFADKLIEEGVTGVMITEGYFPEYDIITDVATYEVKRDRWYERTGNLLIETVSCAEKNSPGWFVQTKADYLVVFINDHEFYMVAIADIKELWLKFPYLWKRTEIEQDAGYHTINWTIPLSLFGRFSWGTL